jgi:hypothetical protein
MEVIKDVVGCGVSGFPEDVVVAFIKVIYMRHLRQQQIREISIVSDDLLQKSFERIARNSCSIDPEDKNEPDLDLQYIGGKAILTLTISVGGIWRPKFVFALLPVPLDKVDILEAKLRDAHEQIQNLNKKLAPLEDLDVRPFLSISSETSCSRQQIVQWDAEEPRDIAEDYFLLSEDDRQVTILQDGVYQVSVRISCSEGYPNTHYLALQRNGVDIAQSGYHGSPQLIQLIYLDADDVLQVKWHGGEFLAIAIANNFSVMQVGKYE